MFVNVPITRYLGDDRPIELNVYAAGVMQDITGYSFELTVNAKAAPQAGDTAEFNSTGELTDPDAGVVHFPIAPGASYLAVGRYFYTVRMTDAAGKDAGILYGSYLVLPSAEPAPGTVILDDYTWTPTGADGATVEHGDEFLLFWEIDNPWVYATYDGLKVITPDPAVQDSGVVGFKPYDQGPIPTELAKGHGLEIKFWIGARNTLRMRYPSFGGFFELSDLSFELDIADPANLLFIGNMENQTRSGDYNPDGDANNSSASLGPGWYRALMVFEIEDLNNPGDFYNALKWWKTDAADTVDPPAWDYKDVVTMQDDDGLLSPWWWYGVIQRNSLGADQIRIAEIKIIRSGIEDFTPD